MKLDLFWPTDRHRRRSTPSINSQAVRVSARGIFLLALLCLGEPRSVAQILVGPAGSGTNVFNVWPTLAEGWATATIGLSSADHVTADLLDQHVITNASVSAVVTRVGSTTIYPPAANTIARWNGNTTAGQGFYLQTRPTGNGYTLLLATIENATGSNVVQLIVQYDWNQRHPVPVTEQIPGHRTFYSFTGIPGSWTLIPGLSTFDVYSSAQPLSATLPVGPLTNGATLYLLWADDNADTGTEGSYTIDNFAVKAVPATGPVITAQPQSQSVAPLNTATFTVTAFGGAPPKFQWRKDGQIIQDATNTTYTIPSVQPGHAGAYSVVVSNAFGSVTSEEGILAVGCLSLPTITAQPQFQTLTTGGTLNLSVGATGTQPFGYQWRRNGVPLPGATNASYSETNALEAASGIYSVLVNNCLGAALSDEAVVSITAASYTLVGLTNHVWRYNESDIDFGTTWRLVGYNDSFWPQGRGVFAWENQVTINALTNTVLHLTNDSSTSIPTYYFRTQFVFTNDPALTALVASNYFDDGAIVYLNGAVALRFNMPSSGVTHTSLAQAANPQGEGNFILSNLPPALLVQGTNTIAVEVHQNSLTSADIAFGMEIKATFPFPTRLEVINQPQDLIVMEEQSAILAAGISGIGARYQWFKDGVPVPGATALTLHMANASLIDAGSYWLVASNAIHSVTSGVATLSVVMDHSPPALLSADLLDPTHVFARFSKPLLASSVTNLAHYSVTNTMGGVATITSAALTNATNVLLTTSPLQANANYVLSAVGILDSTPRHNALPLSAVPVARTLPLVSFGSHWEYYDPFPPFAEPPGPGWKDFDYDTSAWAYEPGAFSTSLQGPPPAPIGTQLDQTPSHSTFFRTAFTSVISPGGLTLRLRHAVADGAVFYLNGVELHRFNMPAGTVTSSTPAAVALSEPFPENLVDLPGSLLRPGQNLLAAELHQFTTNDPLKFFAAELFARTESLLNGPVVLIGGPENTVASESRPVALRVSQAGAAWFQWQMNGTNLPGATNATFFIPATPLALDGAQLRVGIWRDGAVQWSSNATLRVLADLESPRILSARASNDNTLTLTFSEPLDLASATNAANYVVTNGLGMPVNILGITLLHGSNVVLQVEPLVADHYGIVVSNVRDISVNANTIVAGSHVFPAYDGLIVPVDSTWRYDSAGVDRGAASVWAAPAYDDSAWTGTGQALFAAQRNVPPNGSGGSYPAFPEPVRTSMTLSNAANSAQLPTYYFRTRFHSHAAGSATLTLRPVVDDGAVFYLNGVEVFRLGIANNVSPTYATLANRAVGPIVYEGPFTLQVSNLIAGTNVLAVEVHQTTINSSDVAFALEARLALSGGGSSTAEVSPLRLTSLGDQFALSWDRSGLLETAPTPAGPWNALSLSSPHLIHPTNAAAFFRLRR